MNITEPKLSILIPVTWDRLGYLGRLMWEFEKQLPPFNMVSNYGMNGFDIVVLNHSTVDFLLCLDDKKNTIGEKRNALLSAATTPYVAFFDSDDLPSGCYIEEVMKGIDGNYDCCSLVGEITTDGASPKIFRHFLGCEKYDEIEGQYVRYPNHLNTIRTEIAKQFKFPANNFGEDFDWATELHKSGLLKTCYPIEKIIYHYQYITKK